MRDTLKVIGLFFICAFIASCEKNFENRLDPVLPPGPRDSVIRLSKLIFINTNGSETDTTGYLDYVYDSLQRVIIINSYDHNNGTPFLDTIINYYYAGSENKAYKKSRESTDTLNRYSDTTFYFYDNLQRLINDSSISPTALKINQFKYSDTMITAASRLINSVAPPDTFMNADTGIIGSTGNVIAAYTSLTIDSFTYDNKPNPFNQLNIRTTYNPVPGHNFYLYNNYLQINNVLSLVEKSLLNPGTRSTTTYTYSYNALGLPDAVNITDENAPTKRPGIRFFYKKI